MDENEIIKLFNARSETAVSLTQKQYENYCMSIAMNILGNRQDAEECFNDALLAAWESIPPQSPDNLAVYMGKLTRRISINKLKSAVRQKRGGGQYIQSLDELEDCVSDSEFSNAELSDALNGWLLSLPKQTRLLFVGRYYRCESIRSLSEKFGLTQSNVKMILMRSRKNLRKYLDERGVNI